MANIFIMLTICIFEYCMFYDFFHYTMGSKRCLWEKTIAFALLVVITTGINLLNISMLNLILVPLICLAVSIIVFNGNLKTKIFFVIMFYTIVASVEIGFEFFSIQMDLGRNINSYDKIFIILIEKIFTFVILRIIRRIFFEPKGYFFGKSFWLFFITPISSFFIYSGILYSNISVNTNKIAVFFIIGGSFFMLFANILVFYLFEKNFQMANQAKALELSFAKTDLEEKFYKKLELLNYNHSRYIHDLNHYLKAIYGLADENECEKIKNIIKDMQVDIAKLDEDRICQNKILDIILSEKKSEASQYKISVCINVEYNADLSFLSDYDLICIIGNLFENAIEASRKVNNEKRIIDIHIFEANSSAFLMIVIRNNYNGQLEKNGAALATTKNIRNSHGYGLVNVRETAEKYGGFLKINHDENEFIASVALPKNNR